MTAIFSRWKGITIRDVYILDRMHKKRNCISKYLLDIYDFESAYQ